MTGRSPSGRATHEPSPSSTGLGHTVGVPNADDFAAIFNTERGQLLVYKDDSGDDYGLRIVGAPVRGVTPQVTLGYETKERQRENFESFFEHAEDAAQNLFEIADKMAAEQEPA